MVVKAGQYVTFGSDKKYGRVVSVDNSAGTAVVNDGVTDTSGVQQSTIEESTMARIAVKAKPNFREVVENVVAMSIYNPLVAGKGITSPENISFALADAVHEFLLKGVSASFFEMLDATTLDADIDSWFKGSDFTDAFRKIIFVFALTQLSQKLIYKKPMGHAMMHNLLGGYASLVVSNWADRMYFSSEATYSYP